MNSGSGAAEGNNPHNRNSRGNARNRKSKNKRDRGKRSHNGRPFSSMEVKEDSISIFLTNQLAEPRKDSNKIRKKKNFVIKCVVRSYFTNHNYRPNIYQLPFPIAFGDIKVPPYNSTTNIPSPNISVISSPLTDPASLKAPVPKPRTRILLPRNEAGSSTSTKTVSLPATPMSVPVPKPRSISRLPSQNAATAPNQQQSGAKSLLQLMEEDKLTKSLAAMTIGHQDRLPVYSVKRELMEMVKERQVIIVIGDPCSGKSTQLPQYLMEAGFGKNGKIGVTQPSCMAAKVLAERVAYECRALVGSTVGYAIRFERKLCDSTVIKCMTDGVLVKECAANPAHLEEYSVIIVDQAEERSLNTDICMGILKREVERDGSKLKIIISVSTGKHEKFTKYFGDAPVLSIPGNVNKPEIIYTLDSSHGLEENYLREAVMIIEGIKFPRGDILVILSDLEEIQDMYALLNCKLEGMNPPATQLFIVQCDGSLAFKEQMKIFKPAPEKWSKIILATDVIGSFIKMEGVAYVIDCGYCEAKNYDAENGLNYVVKKRISKFQAMKRSGWASGADKGKCFRLYSEQDFEEMEEVDGPEVTRCNLESVILDLAAMGITGWGLNGIDKMAVENFDLMDLPPKNALVEGLFQLSWLSAVEVTDMGIKITEMGKLISSFHLDPPLSRVLIESLRLGCVEETLKIVALLSVSYKALFYFHNESVNKFRHPDGDLLTYLNLYNEWLKNGKRLEWCQALNLQHQVFQEAETVRCQIQKFLERLNKRNSEDASPSSASSRERLHGNIRRSFVAGYFRQFAFKKSNGPEYLILADVEAPNEHVHLSHLSVLHSGDLATFPEFVIFHEMSMSVSSELCIGAVTIIDPEWMREYAPELAEKLQPLLSERR